MIWLVSGILLMMYSYICLKSVYYGLLVLIGSLPLYLIKLNLFSIPTTLLELMFCVVFVFWLFKSFATTRCCKKIPIRFVVLTNFLNTVRRLTPLSDKAIFVGLGVSLLIAGALLGLAQTSNIASSLNAIKSFLIEPVIVGAMILSVSFKEKRFELSDWMLALAIPVAVLSLYAIFQWLTGFGIPDAWYVERRVTSFFPYPNALGHFVAPIITLIIVWFMQRGLKRLGAVDIALLATIPLGLFTIILSFTEAAWVAIATTVVIAGIIINKNRKTWMLICILGGLSIIAIPQARQKLMLQDWSGQTRVAQWTETANFLSASSQNFFLGAGVNNYPVAIAPYHTHEHLEIFQQPHNIFLNFWVEYGSLGLTGFLILAFLIASLTLKNCKNKKTAIAVSAGLTEMFIHGLVDVPYFKNDLSILTWTLLALLLILSYDTDQTTTNVV